MMMLKSPFFLICVFMGAFLLLAIPRTRKPQYVSNDLNCMCTQKRLLADKSHTSLSDDLKISRLLKSGYVQRTATTLQGTATTSPVNISSSITILDIRRNVTGFPSKTPRESDGGLIAKVQMESINGSKTENRDREQKVIDSKTTSPKANRSTSDNIGSSKRNNVTVAAASTEITKDDKLIGTRIVVCVLSTPKNVDARNTIRMTWAKAKPNNTQVLFVLGLGSLDNKTKDAMYKEKFAQNDIIFLPDFTESYEKLTEKVAGTMKWVYENLEFDYFVKVDDDTYLRLDMLLKHLSNKSKTQFYEGYFSHRAPILKKGKWAEPGNYICDKYVSYALGRGYILSNDLVEFVAVNYEKLKKFKNEDVSVGTWLASLQVNGRHENMFMHYGKSKLSIICKGEWILVHPTSLQDMERFHGNLQVNNTVC